MQRGVGRNGIGIGRIEKRANETGRGRTGRRGVGRSLIGRSAIRRSGVGRNNIGRGGIVKWLPLAAGIVCGSLLVWLMGESVLQDEMFFGERLFESEKYTEYKKISYLIYLLKIRGLQTALIIFMGAIRKKKLGLFLWAWLTGCGFGMGGFVMVQRWGAPGGLGYLFMILPHYLCYFYAYGACQNNDYYGQYSAEQGVQNNGKLWQNIMIIGVVITGILLECYVNPFFIKLFANLFL